MTDHDSLTAVVETVGAIIDRRATVSAARTAVERADTFDADLWKELASEFGLCAMHAPEDLGGAGDPRLVIGAVAALGSRLSTLPYLSTVVLGTMPLLAARRTPQGEEVLDVLLRGEQTATGVLAGALEVGRDTVSGRAERVLHGASSDWVLVTAADRLLGVRAQAIAATPFASIDLARPLADLEFRDAPAVPLGEVPPDRSATTRAELMTFLAHESAAGARKVTDMAVEYAKAREQFGRAIGSFQAIKHLCAEMTIDAEAATAAAWRGSDLLGTPEHPSAALAAFLYTTQAYLRTARESLHVHGGIGFTWEFDSHLYYRRSHANTVLIGPMSRLKQEYAASLTHHR